MKSNAQPEPKKAWYSRGIRRGREQNFKKHRIKDLSIVTYPEIYACVMDDAMQLYKKHLGDKIPG